MLHPLLVALMVILDLMTLLWLVSLWLRNASIVDGFWGMGFVVTAWLYVLLADGAPLRAVVVAGLVTVWGIRLSLHILVRNHGKGEDFRYAAMRESHGTRFAWVSLFTVFWLQGAILWVVALPLYQAIHAADAATWHLLDGVAVALFVTGFLFEAVGDWQLARFKRDPANRGKVMDRGLWRYTRHPNYFGDALLWWGVFCFAAATGGWWTIVGPLLMTGLLLKVSGVSLLERSLVDKKPAYRDYVRRTSAFVPWFPRD